MRVSCTYPMARARCSGDATNRQPHVQITSQSPCDLASDTNAGRHTGQALLCPARRAARGLSYS